ncbi:hypothetical protein [Streptomyces sp. NPDC088910]|uniref:hypothetical protein n=1 Tax=Streptomyces sp. NPDC088910 TaxID=3365911 RepID=UPI00382AF2CE
MLKRGKNKRAIVMAAVALALAGGATVGLGGSAGAAAYGPPPASTDWFSLYVTNNAGGRYYLVCNEQSAANTVYVGAEEGRDGNAVELKDVNTGWTTYGANIRFNAGACEEFTFVGYDGRGLAGYIKTPAFYTTGWVDYN